MKEWDGTTERRQSLIDVDERLRNLETQVSVVDATTKDFREYLIKKIDKIDISINDVKTRLFELPCKERVESSKSFKDSVNRQLFFMWGVLSIIIAAIIYEWVKLK